MIAEAESPKVSAIPLPMLESVANGFVSRAYFVARYRVDSEAVLSLDRTICLPGDLVEVLKWHCFECPTDIKVTSRGSGRVREFCIPYSWVREAGAPVDLASYMPFAPQTWPEILALAAS